MAPTTTPTRMTAWQKQAWLVRYLNRQFASEEAPRFEAYAMDRPELLATIEADTHLRDALTTAASTRHQNMSVDFGGRRSAATGSDADGGDTGGAESHDADDTLRVRDNSRANERHWRHRTNPGQTTSTRLRKRR